MVVLMNVGDLVMAAIRRARRGGVSACMYHRDNSWTLRFFLMIAQQDRVHELYARLLHFFR